MTEEQPDVSSGPDGLLVIFVEDKHGAAPVTRQKQAVTPVSGTAMVRMKGAADVRPSGAASLVSALD